MSSVPLSEIEAITPQVITGNGMHVKDEERQILEEAMETIICVVFFGGLRR